MSDRSSNPQCVWRGGCKDPRACNAAGCCQQITLRDDRSSKEKVCGDEMRIIYEHGQPHGIRDRSGFLFFFRKVSKYDGQEERYRRELEQMARLADFLLSALRATNEPTPEPASSPQFPEPSLGVLKRVAARMRANAPDSAYIAEWAVERIEELEAIFDLRWKADMRAIKRWQEAHPGNDLTWPDHADLVVWLLEQRAPSEPSASQCECPAPGTSNSTVSPFCPVHAAAAPLSVNPLIARLRAKESGSTTEDASLMEEAALEIELLQDRTERLRAAQVNVCCQDFDNCRERCTPLVDVLRRQLREARAAQPPPAPHVIEFTDPDNGDEVTVCPTCGQSHIGSSRDELRETLGLSPTKSACSTCGGTRLTNGRPCEVCSPLRKVPGEKSARPHRLDRFGDCVNPGCTYPSVSNFDKDNCTASEKADVRLSPNEEAELCEDCPPVNYPTDKTRCVECPRRAHEKEGSHE